jgi:hypothetical protein
LAQGGRQGDVTVSVDRSDNDQPVPYAQVRIVATDQGTVNLLKADGGGIFRLAIPPYDVGPEYKFTVLDWYVVSPCSLAAGVTNLPHANHIVPLKVLPMSDKRLLEAKSTPIGCLILENAGRFPGANTQPPRQAPKIRKPSELGGFHPGMMGFFQRSASASPEKPRRRFFRSESQRDGLLKAATASRDCGMGQVSRRAL